MVFLPEPPIPPSRPAPPPRPRQVPPPTPKPTAAESAAGVTQDDIERARRLKVRTRGPTAANAWRRRPWRGRRQPPQTVTGQVPGPAMPPDVEVQKRVLGTLPNPYEV